MKLSDHKRLDLRRTPGRPSQGQGPDADEPRDPVETLDNRGILSEQGYNFLSTTMGGFWSEYQDKLCRLDNAAPENIALRDTPIDYAWDEENQRLVRWANGPGGPDWRPIKGHLSASK